jgi:cholinesterase
MDRKFQPLTFKQPVLVGNNDNESGGGAMSFAGVKSDPEALAKSNAGFTCPPVRAVESRLKAGLPAWRYRYMYANPVAAHGSELGVVWGTMDRIKRGNLTTSPDEIALSKNVRKAWAAFAKDPKHGLTKFGWPVYDGTKETLALLGEGNKPDIKYVKGSKFDAVCEEYWKGNTTANAPKLPFGPPRGPPPIRK